MEPVIIVLIVLFLATFVLVIYLDRKDARKHDLIQAKPKLLAVVEPPYLVSDKKLFFLCFMTSGTYGFYWFYKQLQWFKKNYEPEISPILGSFFIILVARKVYTYFRLYFPNANTKLFSKYLTIYLALLLIDAISLNLVKQETNLIFRLCLDIYSFVISGILYFLVIKKFQDNIILSQKTSGISVQYANHSFRAKIVFTAYALVSLLILGVVMFDGVSLLIYPDLLSK